MEALAPALQGTAAAGAWGKTERRSWGSDSLTHLGRRWSEEGWRRWWAEVAGYGRGGGAADLGKGRVVVEMVVVAESCAEALFIGRERRWREGGAGGRARRPLMAVRPCRGVAKRRRDSRQRTGRRDGSGSGERRGEAGSAASVRSDGQRGTHARGGLSRRGAVRREVRSRCSGSA